MIWISFATFSNFLQCSRLEERLLHWHVCNIVSSFLPNYECFSSERENEFWFSIATQYNKCQNFLPSLVKILQELFETTKLHWSNGRNNQEKCPSLPWINVPLLGTLYSSEQEQKRVDKVLDKENNEPWKFLRWYRKPSDDYYYSLFLFTQRYTPDNISGKETSGKKTRVVENFAHSIYAQTC